MYLFSSTPLTIGHRPSKRRIPKLPRRWISDIQKVLYRNLPHVSNGSPRGLTTYLPTYLPSYPSILRFSLTGIQVIRAIIIAPTKELSSQTLNNVVGLTSSCSREIRAIDVSSSSSTLAPLAETPDILIGTPSRLLAHVTAGNVDVNDSLE